jgi:hypothetical protein
MTRKSTFHPYQNEAECLQINDLNIENRLDRVSIFGTLDLTRDKDGLAAARALKVILDQTLAELEKADLPERVAVREPEMVKNPFT